MVNFSHSRLGRPPRTESFNQRQVLQNPPEDSGVGRALGRGCALRTWVDGGKKALALGGSEGLNVVASAAN